MCGLNPLLYTTLHISALETKGGSDAALFTRSGPQPPDFFSKTTRRLTLTTFSMNIWGTRAQNPWSTSELERMLCVCTGITELSLTGDFLNPPVFRLVGHMRPTHLDLMGNLVRSFSSPYADFALPLFQRVSHLYLCDIDDELTSPWHHWAGLSRLPVLTHLAIARGDLVPTILATLPRLRVIVLYGEKLDPEEAHSWDQRVVVAEINSFWEDWHEGIGLWIRADAFLDRKQRGEVPESCYQLPAC
ncbi:hypothetical protein MSAN_02007000 [Mycena sanguinolenta]|uniref:Uncharacterized protein n=1 Tax=Mycena sanguinolenta TaxID=230812 RepID=A0A8H6XM20_9AGAR|nr:hypothetical protein MSAN_02007000 [Mycena sanguinolenta]